eukprot:CAMPEP_0118639610 /NCGR_PEP_ID=MMETSP0785-20121206/4312_1 /TAXON_ID=91992 /ORGANISM="Bolidomonas pacifica, Strain CCMP 1866" /LENGTH=209 /DNA_ID=CAMNT_0006530943 /DNA_START=112 /DNA_END=741 /DNA_ORIENTATION=-
MSVRFALPNCTLVLRSGGVTDHGVVYQGVAPASLAIVNAANERMLGGGGVDGAITRAGGDELDKARRAAPVRRDRGKVRCPTGKAVITSAKEGATFGTLGVQHVIHAVGPNYNSHKDGDDLLESAYHESILCAQELNVSHIGFSLISAGVFRGSNSVEHILMLSLRQIHASMDTSDEHRLKTVDVYCFSEKEMETATDVATNLFGPPIK